MLKRIASKKIIVIASALFALFLIYLVPKEDPISLYEQIPKDLEYVSGDVKTSEVYLLTNTGLLGRATFVTSTSDLNIEAKAREAIELLIQDGKGESKVPNGFKAVLPSDTKIISIAYEDSVIKVNFSKELLDVKKEEEETIIEAIVYSLTEIPEIEKVILFLEGDILDKLPQSNITLPSTLDRDFGINKQYEFHTLEDITQVTIYYIDKYNDNYYYVPVTKYMNDDREKIKIIIDELTSSPLVGTNLMSFLSSNAKLLAVEQIEDTLELEFNSYIFDNIEEKNILEEVIYTISLSVADNYDVEEVVFQVGNEEVYKSVLKEIN